MEEQRVIYTVERLNTEIKDLLEHSYPLIWIEAEISNFSRPSSGHWYFTLKDSAAQVRCAMFRNRNQLVRFNPEHGLQVLVRARISLYPARGDFQLIIEHMEEAGAGALQRAYEDLYRKLHAEGLFEDSLKKTLPAVPGRIGVITSETGAALQDVLSVLRRRAPLLSVVLYPVPVQGDAAAPAIVKALEIAAQRNECDLLLLVRGGGSLEDLWAFNEEAVARAIHACPLPVISGVGHETDFTISDYVSDKRAPTPTAAAEMATPDLKDWQKRGSDLTRRLGQLMHQRIGQSADKTIWLEQRLNNLHPGRRLEQNMQRLDELETRSTRALKARLRENHLAFETSQRRLVRCSPLENMRTYEQTIEQLRNRLLQATAQQFRTQKSRLALAGRGLDSLSPLKTLDRGYAIASTGSHIARSLSQLNINDILSIRLTDGSADCRVEALHPTTNEKGNH